MTDVTETEFIKQKAKEEIQDSKIGKVSGVFEHTEADDDTNFEINALIDGDLFEERAVTYTSPGTDSIHVPKVGDRVQIDYFEGENKRPIARGVSYSRVDRAPLGKAGMYRDKYDSGESPSGKGDIKLTGYTNYDIDISSKDKSDASPVETFLQIAKHKEEPETADSASAPMAIEMYDSPTDQKDESRIRLKGNQVDGDDTKSMEVELDMKKGTISIQAFDDTDLYDFEIDVKNGTARLSGDGTNQMGMSLDFNTDEFTLIDGSGYGIESDGSGNFTWHYESINYSQSTTTSL
jgi:hypothetical protein